MPKPLSEATLQIIEATAPVVAQNVDQIVARMYERLFEDAGIRALFNMSHHQGQSPQQKALANALIAYATHIRTPEVLITALERIAQKHTGLQILPEHYNNVASALLGAVTDVLGEAATSEILNAWGEAYWYLANTLITREEQIYTSSEIQSGGWRGWRKFKVVEKTAETPHITSFTLKPVDTGSVMEHRPGQYLSFRFLLGVSEEARRNYSISSAPNQNSYRITVKREAGGRVSNWLHDTIEVGAQIDVAPPAGEFFLDPAGKQEIVLLSGGVGLTPMVSMLEAFSGKGLKTTYIHATQNAAHHAMKAHTDALADQSYSFYEQADDTTQACGNTKTGKIDIDWLTQATDTSKSDYYICGPTGFMDAMLRGLKAAGVSDEQLHYEFFGPTTTQLG